MDSFHFVNTAYIYQKIYDLLSGGYFPSRETVMALLFFILQFLKPISLLLSLFFLTGVIYCNIRIRALMHEAEEEAHGAHGGHGAGGSHGHVASHISGHGASITHGVGTVNKRWEKITEHINSHNSSDWRLAILECDIILDEMLTKMSYHGETIADKLKAVEKSDFLSIDKAWEAHRVRNAVAHEGSNFQITDREARRVVSLYEDVFREFHYI